MTTFAQLRRSLDKPTIAQIAATITLEVAMTIAEFSTTIADPLLCQSQDSISRKDMQHVILRVAAAVFKADYAHQDIAELLQHLADGNTALNAAAWGHDRDDAIKAASDDAREAFEAVAANWARHMQRVAA